MPEIKYPFIPEGKTILYVTLDNEFMQAAKEICEQFGCVKQPTGGCLESVS